MLTSRPLTLGRISRFSARLDARWLVVALGALLPVLVPPAGASAAPQPDRVVAELTGAPQGIGVSGSVLAYGEGYDAKIVVRDGSAPARRLSAGKRGGALDVGRDRRGRPVVVYARCGRRCDLVAFSPSAGRSRIVVNDVRGFVSDVTVGRGRIFWIAGSTVLSRSLEGGPVRREAVAEGVDPNEIDTDGRTLAVVGGGPGETGNGSTALSITRVGSGRARIRGERIRGDEYATLRGPLRGPVVTGTGVRTLFDESTAGVAYAFADFRAGGRGLQQRTTGGTGIAAWDADGTAMAFVEAPSAAGCALGLTEEADPNVLDAPCRIVRARLGGERLLPPRIAMSAEVATVLQTTVAGDKETGRRPLAGVAVQVRVGADVRARLVTNAQGRVTLPPPEKGGSAVVAATTPRSYAYSPFYVEDPGSFR